MSSDIQDKFKKIYSDFDENKTFLPSTICGTCKQRVRSIGSDNPRKLLEPTPDFWNIVLEAKICNESRPCTICKIALYNTNKIASNESDHYEDVQAGTLFQH